MPRHAVDLCSIVFLERNRAADLLLNEWPDESGSAYRKAKEAVLRAMEYPDDNGLNAASRLAFEEAAREAGILVPEPPRDH